MSLHPHSLGFRPALPIEAQPPTVSIDPVPPLAGVQILLVEDEPDLAALLTLILETAGAVVFAVPTAAIAQTTLPLRLPDLLIANVKSADCEGTHLIRHVRTHANTHLRHLPAIAVASYTREVHGDRLVQAGYQVYLPKPHDPDELIAVAQVLVQRARGA